MNCPQGNGTAAENADYKTCIQNCIVTGGAATTNTEAATGTATGTGAATGAATGGAATAGKFLLNASLGRAEWDRIGADSYDFCRHWI
jgi:hypothetical protein